jgi:hypothetical protein
MKLLEQYLHYQLKQQVKHGQKRPASRLPKHMSPAFESSSNDNDASLPASIGHPPYKQEPITLDKVLVLS